MKRVCGLAVFAMVYAAGTGRAATEERPAAQLAALCASCHRLDNHPSGIPPIASLDSSQIVAMMRAFRTRRQSSHIMYVVSRSLTDAEIDAVAGYLSGLRKRAP